jgi:hypothetical protein
MDLQTQISATSGSGKAVVQFGDYSLGLTTTERFLYPGTADNGTAKLEEVVLVCPFAGLIQNLHVTHTVVGTGSSTLTYTVRKNLIDTALSVVVLNTTNGGSDMTNSFSVVAGDRLSISVNKSNLLTGSPNYVLVALEITL